MSVRFEHRENAVIATLSGNYVDPETYRGDLRLVYSELESTPQRVVVSLGEMSGVNKGFFRYLEGFALKVAKDLRQEIRFARPTESRRKYHFLLPIYGTVDEAFESFIAENAEEFERVISFDEAD